MSISVQTRAMLRAAYLAGLHDRLEEMLALRARHIDGDPTVAAEIRTLGHHFAGMGGSYGFPEHTDQGRALERATPEALALALDALIDLVRSTLRHASPTPADDP